MVIIKVLNLLQLELFKERSIIYNLQYHLRNNNEKRYRENAKRFLLALYWLRKVNGSICLRKPKKLQYSNNFDQNLTILLVTCFIKDLRIDDRRGYLEIIRRNKFGMKKGDETKKVEERKKNKKKKKDGVVGGKKTGEGNEK